MGFSNSYRQHHYMGEWPNDFLALTLIQSNCWDSLHNGNGTPQNGQMYYNTVTGVYRAYLAGAWTDLAAGGVSKEEMAQSTVIDNFGSVVTESLYGELVMV
jgi:hypothetical protein